MPIYQFINVKTGEIIEEIRAVNDCDRTAIGYERIRVPQTLAIAGGSSDRPPTPGEEALRGYYEMELRGEKLDSEFTVKQIKEAWSPENNG